MTARVVHLASGREWRGGQRQVWLLARELASLEVRQVVVTGGATELAARLERDGIPVHPVTWRAGLDPRVLPALLSELGPRDTLVHAHDAHALTLAGLATRLVRRPLVVTRRVDFHLRRRGLWARADRIVAISEAVAGVLVADGISRERVTVVHSGISLEDACRAAPLDIRALLGLPADTLVAANVAALVPHKDHATLLRAAAASSATFPSLHWVIAGAGPERARLEGLRQELGLEQRVHFLGHVEEPVRLVADADLFVMSSREEGLGTSVLEAMARGIPVASTAAGGLPEMLRDGAGLLVPVGDAGGLAAAVARVLSEPGLGRALVDRAGHAVQHFTSARMAEAIRSVYRSCVPLP
jgi:glycosyltransferase involved in cell wall biosynthesis